MDYNENVTYSNRVDYNGVELKSDKLINLGGTKGLI